VVRFIGPNIVVHVGDTVEFANHDPITPHTITFGVEPRPTTCAAITECHNGPRWRASRHPQLRHPLAHTRFIVAGLPDQLAKPQTPIGVTRFRVTFTHAGTYPYICSLHDDLGMTGRVIVTP
jgi:plastocyanin